MKVDFLFSYGTLQYEAVQISTIGKTLKGYCDQLTGYRMGELKIQDPHVIATSGKDIHNILVHTGNPMDEISGTVFAITQMELEQIDAYEVADYMRTRVTLASGRSAWVYVAR